MKYRTPARATPCDCTSTSSSTSTSGSRSTSTSTSTLTKTPLRSVSDVAALLGVHPKTVRRLIKRGELVARRIGRSVRVSERDLQAYLDRC